MIYSIRITQTAENDLLEIVDYISSELLMPETALEQIRQIKETVYSLEKFPERYQVIKIMSLEAENIRRVLINNYAIFYQVKERTVFILRVLYVKRNWVEII